MFIQQNFKKFFLFAVILVFGMVFLVEIVFADLTKQDMEEIRKIIKEEIYHVDKRIDELKIEIKDVRTEIKDVRTEMKDFMLWGFGIIFFGILTLVGFVLWDRRSALAPAIRQQEVLAKKGEAMERALRELAMKEPRFAEALKIAGLL